MLEHLEPLLENTLQSMDCALYDVALLKENQRDILRISIKALKGPTTLDTCQEASLLISPLLDVHANMPGAYTLEVSSMGLERALSKLRHFALSIGDLVEVRTLDHQRFKGVVQEVQGDVIVFRLEEEIKHVPFAQIKKAKSVFEFEKVK
ncbi:ribosome maturation factor RimP [Helicobacter baculiformis]|uniref:Ribosome maturation factor RimP n=1 Tax=Helicobacter baculiformis TaxID=427351 RepID=A0ABV7ZHW0_9HELI|nr:ribosome maturation factor RimP [Helicobacter baculiformis]